MGRQTRRKSYSAVRKRKYFMRRVIVLLVLLAVIGGLTFLLIKLLKDKKAPGAEAPAPSVSMEGSPSPQASETPAETPVAELPASLTPRQQDVAGLSAIGFESSVMFDGAIVENYQRPDAVSFGRGDEYTDLEGIITFAGNNYRNSFTYGVQQVEAKTLSRAWDKSIGALDCGSDGYWTGTGWTGMPLIIRWEEDVRETLGVFDEFRHKDGFTEVIYPTMDGNIYFFELSTGKSTRDPINIGVVTKGTASLDPRGYPLLYTGQGIQSTNSDGNYGAWFRAISLIENKVIWSFGGRDPFSYRAWQAYDSSALVSVKADTLITGGENGVMYSVKLNAAFDAAAGTVSIDPGPLTKYRYTASGYGESDSNRWYGIENSIAAWREYVFFTDNGGYLQCVNSNTLETVYTVDVTDDSDSSIVIEEDAENGTFYLYTANEVDKQAGTSSGYGKSYHRKIDGITGKVVWEVAQDASVGNTSSNGGTLVTPHVGHGSIDDIVIYASTLVPVTVDGQAQNGGRIIAYDKASGRELWRYEQAAGYWSSPVVIYDENETAYLIQCDRSGIMRMHDPRTGSVICELDMGSRIESTPAVFGNMLVVGTRGQYGSGDSQKIIGVRIG